jgi:hypothetical protein
MRSCDPRRYARRPAGCGQLEVRRQDQAMGAAFRRHHDLRLSCGLALQLGLRTNSRTPAFHGREGLGRWVVDDVRFPEHFLLGGFARGSPEQAPYHCNHQDVPEYRLEKRPPRHAGIDKNVVPERAGTRRGRNLGYRPSQERVGQVAEENAMGRLLVEQQFEARHVGASIHVRSTRARAFVQKTQAGNGGRKCANYSPLKFRKGHARSTLVRQSFD